MNEQATMMNQQQHQHQHQHQQMMSMNQNMMSMNRMNPLSQPQVMNFNQNKPCMQSPVILQSSDWINFQPQMVQMNRKYGMWPKPQQFQKPNPSHVAMKPAPSSFNKSLGPRSNWKGKKVNKPNDKRRTEKQKSVMTGLNSGGIGGVNIGRGGGGGVGVGGNLKFNNYNPPTLNELQHQNRLKTRKFFQKKFNKNNNMNMSLNMGGHYGRSAPFAPRNTTSFLIRAKKSGGIAPLVSPYPVTPAVLPTPIFSPSREVLVDMAKEEWGVDGYGSMKGLIRLRSPGHEMEAQEDDEEDEGSSSESDVEEHVEVERRLDHDLSRFEMIYDPSSNNAGGMEYHNVLENRVDDQDSHIAQLEEENLILKERLFLMERELGDLRRRMMSLEKGNRGEETNEEVVENESENESESRGDEANSVEDNNDVYNIENVQGDEPGDGKIFELDMQGKVENENKGVNASEKNSNITDVESKEESNSNSDELIEANRLEVNTADMDEDVEGKVQGSIDVESDEHVMVKGDLCMSEDQVAQDYDVSDRKDAN